MKVERTLQACIAVMAALAITMLGSSQDSVTLPFVGLLVAFLAFFFTDLLGWFSLHPFLAGLAGVIAGGNAFLQAQSQGIDAQFLAVANLLIHLQIILLFQKKNQRIYWQLLTLSLLQVVVAAALNLFVAFGPLLVCYTAFAIAAMLLFFLQRQQENYLTPTGRTFENADKSVSLYAMQSSDEPLGKKRRRRRTPMLRRSLLFHYGSISVSTMIVSAAVFLFMPRFGDGVWRAKGKAVTGLSEADVDLDDVNSIYEDPTLIMRVSFHREGSNEPYMVSGFPYFRSSVRERYRNGRWSRRRGKDWELEFQAMSRLTTPTRVYSAIRQKSILEASVEMVCTVAPPCGLHDVTESMRMCPRTLEVKNFPESNSDAAEYSIGTLGFRNGLQSEFIPHLGPAYFLNVDPDEQRYVRSRLPELTAKAAEIVKDIPKDNVLQRARALERYFTDGRAKFKYSLDPSPDRDEKRWPDPVEDFVVHHKTGHCQFFASALVLMLRSQGIEARYVSGFRADSYNVVGGYYQLRAMDAHAWVEAAIPASQLPRDEIMPTEGLDAIRASDVADSDAAGADSGNVDSEDNDDEVAQFFDGEEATGAWVRLDPTPGGDLIQTVAVSPWRQKVNDSIDYMQLLWSEYVLGLNEKRQRKAIYEPIINALKNSYALAFSKEVWAERFETIRQRLAGGFFTRDNMRDAGVAIVVLTIAFYALRFLARVLWRWIASRWRTNARRRKTRVEFYERLEKILAKHSIRRKPGQTHSEFAQAAKDQIETQTSQASLAEIPHQIVEQFYRVRFGDAPLDPTAARELDGLLGTLESSL